MTAHFEGILELGCSLFVGTSVPGTWYGIRVDYTWDIIPGKKENMHTHLLYPQIHCRYTVVPALKTLGLSQLPAIKTTFFTEP